MKTRLLMFVMVIASCFFKTATAQTVTSVAGLDFGTDCYKAKNYLTNHFGNSYGSTGDYQLRFCDIMIGGITYENTEFYFKDSKFIAARFYTGFPLTKFNNAKSFRDRIISRYKEKYTWHNKPYTSDGFQCYCFGKPMDSDYGHYPILVRLYKANSTEGELMYWVECDYYMELVSHDNDDI